jgi:hypothetical protein
MYCTGHVLSSTLLATLGARRFRLRFVPLASGLIAMNALDIDHVFTCHLDDGTVNSLVLHGLHVYGGVLLLFILIWGFVLPNRPPTVFLVACGAALHYAGDAFAYAIGYHMPSLIALDVLILTVLLNIQHPLSNGYALKGHRWFFVSAAIFCSGAQLFVHFALELRPPFSIVPCILSPALTLLVACAFFLLFNRQEQRILAMKTGAISPLRSAPQEKRCM